MSAISKNQKTGYSVDFTTDCPKRRDGKACKYCYVESARNMNYNAKKIVDYCPYVGEIKRFSEKKVAFLNRCGGIRLFSFGDYMSTHDGDIASFLNDCESVGLRVKAITKQPEFVEKFHDFAALAVINVSVDNVGDGVDWNTAKSLRNRFPKVRIRSAIMKPEDVETLSFSDVYTFNHAAGFKSLGWKKFSRADVLNYAEKLGNKVCCTTGKCETCPLLCAQ